MIKITENKNLLVFVIASICVLAYFVATNQSKGDEADWYLKSLQQSYKLFPQLDFSPYWTVSSFYLWIIATFHTFLTNFTDISILTSGRIFSLLSWVFLLLFALKHYPTRFTKVLLIIFNPYFLVYATRAHPLVPSILMVLLFWYFLQKKSKLSGLFLVFAVNFQVFTGGITGMFLPDAVINFTKSNIVKLITLVFIAICGVLITWLTWGGIYPEQFINHSFYTKYHKYGMLTYGYLPAMFMLSGATLWFIGDEPLKKTFRKKKQNGIILAFLILSGVVLYCVPDITGSVNNVFIEIVPNWHKPLWIITYIILGLGWCRVNESRFSLIIGVLSCAILLVVLPYFYERIAVFASLSPCLLWILRNKEDNTLPQNYSLSFGALFLLFAAAYEIFGAL